MITFFYRMPYLPKLRGRTNESFKRRQSIFLTSSKPVDRTALLLPTSTASKSTTSSLIVDQSSRQMSVVSGETDSVVKSMKDRRRRYGQEEASKKLRSNLMEMLRPEERKDIYEPEPNVKRVQVIILNKKFYRIVY